MTAFTDADATVVLSVMGAMPQTWSIELQEAVVTGMVIGARAPEIGRRLETAMAHVGGIPPEFLETMLRKFGDALEEATRG